MATISYAGAKILTQYEKFPTIFTKRRQHYNIKLITVFMDVRPSMMESIDFKINSIEVNTKKNAYWNHIVSRTEHQLLILNSHNNK